MNCSFSHAPVSAFRDAFMLTNLPFGLDKNCNTKKVQKTYDEFEVFLKEHFEEFREIFVINSINKHEKNFMNRKNGLKWERRFEFYSGGLRVGLFQLKAVDWEPETVSIDNPFNIVKRSSAIPTKGEIKRKLNYAMKTGSPPNLTKKELAYKKKFKIKSQFDLDHIDKIERNSKAKNTLYEKLKSRRRNKHLKTKKEYEEKKSEKIFKKIEKEDKRKVKMLEENVKKLIQENQGKEIRQIWENMTGKPIAGLEDPQKEEKTRPRLTQGDSNQIED